MGVRRPPLKIAEIDGSPSGWPSTLKVTNATLTDNGDGSFTLVIGTGSAVTVQEEDGSPSVSASTIKFPSGSMIDNGGGSVSVRDVPTGFIGAKAYNAGTLTLTNNTETAVTLNTEDYDSDAFHSTSSNTSRFTIPAGLGGKYRLTGFVRFTANATGYRGGWWRVNGSGYVRGSFDAVPASAATISTVYPTVDIDLAAGDYVELFAFQNSGGNLVVGDASLDYLVSAASVVKLDSGKIGAGVGASAYKTASQSLSDATWTALTLTEGEHFDTDAYHSVASNQTRFTIPAGLGGKYLVRGGATFAANGTGRRYLAARVNGSAITGNEYLDYNSGDASTNQTLSGACVLDVLAGDYIEVYAYQSSGGALNALSATGQIMRLDAIANPPNPIASGSLPTVSPASGTALQVSTDRDVHLVVPITFNPTGIATATLAVALSPDNVTFSTLVTKTYPAIATLAGSIDEVSLKVPKSWYVKLTATNATLGTGTYY